MFPLLLSLCYRFRAWFKPSKEHIESLSGDIASFVPYRLTECKTDMRKSLSFMPVLLLNKGPTAFGIEPPNPWTMPPLNASETPNGRSEVPHQLEEVMVIRAFGSHDITNVRLTHADMHPNQSQHLPVGATCRSNI